MNNTENKQKIDDELQDMERYYGLFKEMPLLWGRCKNMENQLSSVYRML